MTIRKAKIISLEKSHDIAHLQSGGKIYIHDGAEVWGENPEEDEFAERVIPKIGMRVWFGLTI